MGIHTLSMKCDTELKQNLKLYPFIKDRATKNSDGSYSYIINPNKFNEEITKFSEYEFAMDNIISCLEPNNPVLTRIDYSINCYDDNFEQLYKLNKVLILLLCAEYKFNNKYGSFNLLSDTKLCSRVQNARIEIENYNKSIENPFDKTKNRLEFRSKCLGNIPADNKERTVFQQWLNRLDNAVTVLNLQQLQEECNEYIYQRYESEKQKHGFNMRCFVKQNESFIFTQQQLTNFYSMTGLYKNPNAQARKYKSNNELEYIPFQLLQLYVDTIKNSAEVFFSN